CQQGFRSPRTF
nr:immunoglobulin light chain junction region [Macaca mulatta]MOX23708.1 immunoglobulin light chain junction region [Macaca mulatta]MOX24045.1 immunoglobulin light chain junction region [Macaca mulatta]MOX24067.1 immunoglobulin light chain junction region [Macaca mulatta]MOX24414.1 immunoglobulin light chain junction region [Macaca mulatta]